MVRANHHFTKVGDGWRELGVTGRVELDFTKANLKWGGGLENAGPGDFLTRPVPWGWEPLGMGAGPIVGKGLGWPDIPFT